MQISIYPGSFDPITLGHIDIIERASKITDRLIVTVLNNIEKKAMFSVEERVDMINESIKNIKNVEVASYDGLLVEFAKKMNANLIIRGLRTSMDFENELRLAQTNRVLHGDIDTVFLLTNLEHSYLSSSGVKEVALYKGDISKFVPPHVERKIKEKIKSGK